MANAKVIIAGGGIAGPILGIFLKSKGYDVVIYERAEKDAVTGISLLLQPNGLRVLSLIPGLVDKIPGRAVQNFRYISILPDDEGVLADTDFPSQVVPKEFGFSMMGVRRAALHQVITQLAEEHGVEIKYEHQVVSLEQSDHDVRVVFQNGQSDLASFVVGCDGLHSNTRTSLFGKEQASFTGLTQTGGFSRTPAAMQGPTAMTNIFGDNAHFIVYQITETHTSWAVTLREAEEKETWRAMDEAKQEAFRHSAFSTWGYGAGDLIKNAEKVVKYGLYDRPALKTWHKGRVVLLGDAAHPTSPHLGQGANQAFEDIYHLVRVLVRHNPTAASPSTDILSAIFTEYENVRIPRTTELVKNARKMGESRVVSDVEVAKKRNEGIREMWKDQESMVKSFSVTLNAPFTGKSEI